jgi:S-formylglutathione hydrolase FrmB
VRRKVLALAVTTMALAGGWSSSLEVTGAVAGVRGVGTVRVYVPEGARAGQRFPLVLALHGWGHSPQEFIRNSPQLEALAQQHQVVVAVPDLGKSVYETRFYPQTRGAWTTAPGTPWVLEVVLPWLRAHLPVHGDRAHTAVLGYSTGGRGAVLLAECSKEFAFAGSASGTFSFALLSSAEGEAKIHAAFYGPRASFPERWALDDCVSPARLAGLEGTRLYIAHGAEDHSVRPDQLEALRAALRGSTVQAQWVLVPGAGHTWEFWNAQWPPMFAALVKALAP